MSVLSFNAVLFRVTNLYKTKILALHTTAFWMTAWSPRFAFPSLKAHCQRSTVHFELQAITSLDGSIMQQSSALPKSRFGTTANSDSNWWFWRSCGSSTVSGPWRIQTTGCTSVPRYLPLRRFPRSNCLQRHAKAVKARNKRRSHIWSSNP